MRTAGWLRWLLVPVVVLPIGWLLLSGFGRDPMEIASPQITRYSPWRGTSAASSPSTPNRSTRRTSRLPSRPGAERTASTSASRSGIGGIEP